MSNDLDINAALNAHLATLPDLPPIAWPNRAFEPSGAPLWYEVTFLPRGTDAPFLADDSALDYGGVYQIAIMTQLGIDESEGLTQAGIIRAHFARGLKLTYGTASVRIRRTTVAPGMVDGSYYRIPVSVYYRAILSGA